MKKLFNVLILCFLCISTLIAQNSFGPAPASSHQPHQTSMEPMRSLNSPSIVTFDTDINTFELGTPDTTTSLGTAPEFLNSCEYVNGMYYGTTSTSGLLLSIDPSTGTVNQIATGNHSGAIAYNPADASLQPATSRLAEVSSVMKAEARARQNLGHRRTCFSSE